MSNINPNNLQNKEMDKIKSKIEKALIEYEKKHNCSVDSLCFLKRGNKEWFQHSVIGRG